MKYNRQTITLRPSKVSSILLLLVCSLFVVLGIWMAQTEGWIGYLCAALFALGMPIFIIKLLPGSTYLRIRDHGIIYCSLFRETVIPWDVIDEFFVITIRQNGLAVYKMVGFNYAPSYNRPQIGHRLSSSIANCEGALPDTYGKKAEDLAELLNACLHEFKRAHGN